MSTTRSLPAGTLEVPALEPGQRVNITDGWYRGTWGVLRNAFAEAEGFWWVRIEGSDDPVKCRLLAIRQLETIEKP